MKKEKSAEKRYIHSVKKWKRIIAVTLSVLMVTSMIDYSGFINVSAQTSSDKETITSFAELPEDISNQQIALDASESDINLPDTLQVTVTYVQEANQTEEENSQDSTTSVSDEKTAENAREGTEESKEESKEENTEENIEEYTAENADKTTVENTDNNIPENRVENNESEQQETVTVESSENYSALPSQSVETLIKETSKDITLDKITWKISTTAGKCGTFDSSVGGAVFIYEPVLPEEYALEEGLSLPQIKVQIKEKEDSSEWAFCERQSIDGVEITVKAEQDVFPEGAILHAEKITNAEKKEKIESTVNNEVKTENPNKTIEELIAFDITITDADGNEVQPDTNKGKVKVSFARLSMTENGGITEDDDIQVFHMNDALSNAEKLESSVDDEGMVEAVAEHFSVYAITETIDTPDTDTMTTLYINKGNITIGDGTVSGYDASGTEITTANSNGYIITRADTYSSVSKYTVTVSSGTHNIVLKDVSLYLDPTITNSPFSIESGAKVNLVLEGTNYLRNRSTVTPAGLHVPAGAELVIAKGSTGSMTAFGGPGAGIGGNADEAGGTITINGGTLDYVSGGTSGAGIGGGSGGAGGNITINGGTLTDIRSSSGAGIGGGSSGAGGTITINGGTINAKSTDGAGIGGGENGAGGSISIQGGTVNATGSSGAAIGGGESGDGGIINISSGAVTATSNMGAGIGGGAYDFDHTGGTITISGGTVTAATTNSEYGVGIGNGFRGGTGAGAGGTLSSGGNFVSVNATGVNADTSEFSGVIEDDGNKTVYGSYTLSDDLEIISGKTMMLSSNSALIIPDGKTLTVNGTLNYTNGTFTNNGTLAGTGTLIPALDVNITGDNSEIAFTDTVDLNTLFTIPSGAGSATYTLEEGGTGTGSITDATLTVTRAGTFFITVNTAATGFYKAGSKTMTLTIQNKNVNSSDISIVPYSGTYDGASHDAVTVTGMPAGTSVSYCASADGTFSADCPQVKDVSDTGKSYYVKISGDNYNTWTSAVSGAINITPASVSYSEITAIGKTYDGTTVVGSDEWDVSGAALTGVLDADKDMVSLSISNAQYESQNAGSTRILFTASLAGAASENYRLQSGLENGSVAAAIAKKELMVLLNTEAQKKANNLQLGDSMPFYTVDDLTMTGFVNDETEATAGIDSTNLQVLFSQNDTNNLLTDGIITISGLNSTNYSFTYTQGSLKVVKKAFASTPYTVTGSHNGKNGNDLWYNGTITIAPNVSAGNFTYINSSTDGGATWQGWGTLATISTETNSTDVKIKLSTGANGTGAVLISDDATTSNLEGVICRLDTTAPSYPDSPADTYGIKVKDSWWRNLLNTITFGNFFDESQVVSVTAKEEGSGIAGTYFYKESVTNKSGYTPLTSTQLDALSADKWSSSCTVVPDGNYVVYAYTVDKAGNKSSYLCTDGLVLDATAPVIQNVTTQNLLDVSTELKVTATDSNGIKTYYAYISGTALASENQTAAYIKANGISGATDTLKKTGLSANTTYYYYAVAEDETGNTSAVKSGSFKTTMTQPMNVTVPTVAAVSYGTKVSNITLNGGSAKQADGTTELAGVWSWSDAEKDTYPAVGNSKAYEVIFTPSDPGYASVSKTIVPTINAVVPAIILTDSKNNTYNGSAVSIGAATVTGAAFTGAEMPAGIVTYTYYTDESCTNKTGTEAAKGGAAGEGQAPVNAGTYYVKAAIAANGSYTAATSEKATLVIGKAAPTLTIQGSIGRDYDGAATIIIPKNGVNGYSASLTTMPAFTFYTDAACTIRTDTDTARGGASGEGQAPVNAGTYYVKASYAETANYSAVTSAGKLTYTIRQMEQTITGTTNYTKTYGDSIFTLDASRTAGDGSLSYTITSGNGVISVNTAGQVTILKAGSASVRVTAAATKNAKTKNFDVAVVVNKAPLSIASYTISDKDYDGTTAAAVLGVNFSGYVNGEGPFTSGIDYTAEAVFASKDAGSREVTGTVALKTGSALAQNYSLSQNTLSGVGATIRTIAPTYSVAPQNITINKKLTDINAATTASGVQSETIAGTLTWAESDGGTTLTDSYRFTGSENTQVTLYWTFAPTGTGSSNYKTVKGSTLFTLTTKEVPKLNVGNLMKIYDGEGVTVSSLTKTAKVNGTDIAGTFIFASATPELKKAGSYTATVQFIPDDTKSYTNGSTEITVTINKRNADIAVHLSKQNLTIGESLPTACISYDNVVSGESLVPTTVATFAGMPADSNTANTYRIIWSNQEAMKAQIDTMAAASNYSITYHTTADFIIKAKSDSKDKDGTSGHKGNGSSNDGNNSKNSSNNNNNGNAGGNENSTLPNLSNIDNNPTTTNNEDNNFRNTDNAASKEHTTKAGKPFIKDDAGKEGWDVIKEQTQKAEEGRTVIVEMNGARVVPGDVLNDIKGKDITYVFDMGNNITWSINGKSIISDRVEDIDFKVTTGTNAIPADVISSLAGEDYALNLSLAYHGTFGFTAVLTINMEEENAGRYANLFYYNEQTGELEFMSAGEIGEDGNAELVFTHASEYTIVVDKEPMDGSTIESKTETVDYGKADDKADTPAKENGWNPLWFIMIGAIVILIGGVAVFIVKRKKGEA